MRQIDPTLEDWRELAAAWFKDQQRGRSNKKTSLDKFLLHYLHEMNLERNRYNFMRKSYPAPSFWDRLALNTTTGIAYNNHIHIFLNWVMEEKLSMEDNDGYKIVPNEYHNPVPRRTHKGLTQTETMKTPLPYRYIKELRKMLCQGPHFRDWVWAQQAIGGTRGSDWFEVEPGLIDEADPDCVWRKRTVNNYRISVGGSRNVVDKKEIYELWSPVRAVGLYIKLELPLRTYQVRMLDSGEADTWRYENGQWRLNDLPLAIGSEKRPYLRGIFHRSVDAGTRQTMTGFYINTNKTADVNKDEREKGYVIPWQNDAVLYWLEKLRNWQEKYNPIDEPVAWVSLDRKHFGDTKPHKSILYAMGTCCFLFRNAAAKKNIDRTKPLIATALRRIWYLLLAELEKRSEVLGETLDDGSKIQFVDPNADCSTYYNLHSLRVSLMTAYALEGGVPFPILSKLIVGHARLIMTLYYTKAGKAHVTEVMQEAEKRLFENEQVGYRRFLQEAAYQQIEEHFAFTDPAAIIAANQQKSAAGFVVEDKGICPVGCGGCDVGGECLKDNKSDPNQKVYAPVAGYPTEKNCVRCRFFISGPAFLPGLIAHFNFVSYQLTECSNRYVHFEQQINEIEDLRLVCEAQDRPFLKTAELDSLSRHYEEEAVKADKLCHDLHATLRLIDRCKQLLGDSNDDGIKLVPVGGISDLRYALEETTSEMYQIEVICKNATFYPETDAGKATLRRTQILDAMLAMNGRSPVFFSLTQDQQLLVGNEVMRLIQTRTGSLRNAVAVAEGKVLLREIGLLEETLNVIENQVSLQIPYSDVIPTTGEKYQVLEHLEWRKQ